MAIFLESIVMEQSWFNLALRRTVQEVPLFPSIREAVMVPGTLRGSEFNAPCTVRAVKVSIPRLDVWEYVKVEVAQAPSELPAGNYQLTFDGRTMKADKISADWRIAGF